jgi:hypothetical protein
MDCEECGFSYESLSATDAPDTLRGFGQRYRIPMTRGLKGEDLGALLRAHPIGDTWSALEYACHVRDVLAVQAERIGHALEQEGFYAEPMRRDDLVTERDYNAQDPIEVADDLGANADVLAGVFADLSPEDWDRTLVYHADGERTLLWVAQHTVHEGEHHLLDIGRVLRMARGR